MNGNCGLVHFCECNDIVFDSEPFVLFFMLLQFLSVSSSHLFSTFLIRHR